jgi:hypothetical protein
MLPHAVIDCCVLDSHCVDLQPAPSGHRRHRTEAGKQGLYRRFLRCQRVWKKVSTLFQRRNEFSAPRRRRDRDQIFGSSGKILKLLFFEATMAAS